MRRWSELWREHRSVGMSGYKTFSHRGEDLASALMLHPHCRNRVSSILECGNAECGNVECGNAEHGKMEKQKVEEQKVEEQKVEEQKVEERKGYIRGVSGLITN